MSPPKEEIAVSLPGIFDKAFALVQSKAWA
jgi:hypothetical protein